MKKVFQWIFLTNIGKLITSLALSAISLFLANYINYMEYVAIFFFVIFPLPWFLIAMVYAWIINPINDKKQQRLYAENGRVFNNWKDKMLYYGFTDVNYNVLLNNYQIKYANTNLNDFQNPEQLFAHFGIKKQ